MLRASQSRRRAELALRRVSLLWVVGLLAVAPAHAEGEGCPPLEQPAVFAQLAPSEEPGLEPASSPAGAGEIVSLPRVDTRGAPQSVSGEALLALPKAANGSIPTDFELGAGARVAESFFSPVLCATVARVTGPKGSTPEALVPVIPDTAVVVPNHIYATAAAEVSEPVAATGPDPYRSLQYGLDQVGAEPARALSNGAGVRVAVLDSAPDPDHRDLAHVRVIAIEDGPSTAPAVHGTLVTGVIAAVEGNAFGIAGIAPGVDVVAVPVCAPAGATASDSCALYDLLRGLDAAWTSEAQIINLALVGPDNTLLARAASRLDQLGALVVAAAGNEGTEAARYPAAYPSVIGVGAVDRERELYARSNRGPSAELLAPGVEVLSTVPGDVFSFGSGTSLAAAHVSGALAVLLGAGIDAPTARAALFQAAHAEGQTGAVPLPTVCEVFARLGRSCGP